MRRLAALDDPSAPVRAVDMTAVVAAAMDATDTFTRATVRLAVRATGRDIPDGIQLTGTASASRDAAGIAYALALARGADTLASFDAVGHEGSSRLEGSWRLDLRDTDLQPFALGRRLPTFYAVGTGRYEADARSADLHAQGRLHVSAGRLGEVSPGLAALGDVVLESDFDFARAGKSLKVDRLQFSLDSAGPVASVRALQPFEFNISSGELKVGRPSGDLVGISLTGLPLAWLEGKTAGIRLTGGDARGEFVIRAEDGRLALRTKAPLTARGVTLSCSGRVLGSGLDVSTFVLADYAALGWQVQLSPLSFRSAGVRLLSIEARFGQLSGTDEATKAAGSWSATLPTLLAQPFAAGLPALASGEATGSFEASLGAKTEVRVKLVAQDMVAAPGFAAVLPPYVSSELRADFGPDGRTAFDVPVRVDYGSRAAEILVSGTLDRDVAATTFDVTCSGSGLNQDDLSVVAALASGPVAVSAGGEGPAAPPPPLRGRLALKLRDVSLPGAELHDLRGTLVVEPGKVQMVEFSGLMGDSSKAHLDGTLQLPASSSQPYSFRGNFSMGGVDSSWLFGAADPARPPAIQGLFDVDSSFECRGRSAREFLDAVQGRVRLSSRDGRFRALHADVIDSIKQTPSKIVSAVDSVTSLFGKKTEKLGEALVESAGGLSEIHYDQMSVTAERGADLDVRLTEISLIAPEERISGTGRISYAPATAIEDQPFAADLDVSVRGRLGKVLDIVGMLRDSQDALGYAPFYQPVHLGGTLRNIDQSQWKEMLLQAPLRKGSGLIDKLLGR